MQCAVNVCPNGGTHDILSSSCFFPPQAASEGRVLRERRVQEDQMDQVGGKVEEKKETVSWSELLDEPGGMFSAELEKP